jgi:hypothetical protein
MMCFLVNAMAVLIIPLINISESGNLNFTTTLDGTTYKIFLKHNERDNCWYMSLEDLEENLIRSGIKIVTNWPLLRLLRSGSRPEGELIAVDTRFTALDPNLEEFGAEIEFAYLEKETTFE